MSGYGDYKVVVEVEYPRRLPAEIERQIIAKWQRMIDREMERAMGIARAVEHVTSRPARRLRC